MSQGEDDRLLIEEAQRDPARFGQLYEQNFFCVYAYIARRSDSDIRARTGLWSREASARLPRNLGGARVR